MTLKYFNIFTYLKSYFKNCIDIHSITDSVLALEMGPPIVPAQEAPTGKDPNINIQ